jgi:uncharacterized RDD family membrane protein YckC
LKEPSLHKKPENYALEYAGFWLRLGAGVLDAIFLFLLLFFLYSVVGDYFYDIYSSFFSMFAAGVISLLIKFSYFISFWVWKGQTPGKMIAGIKIIRTDSSPLDWTHAVLRFVGYIASTLALFLGFICITFDPKKQGWHDKLADTYVVKLPVRQVVLSDNYARGRIG